MAAGIGPPAEKFAAHNAEVARVWEAYRAGRPVRVPVTFSVHPKMVLLDPARNPEGYTFRRFTEDPAVMWEMTLAFQRWVRFELAQDAPMGLPEEWPMGVNFSNTYEAAWFGCEVVYPDADVPDTRPMLEADKEALEDLAWPDPLRGNLMGRAVEFIEYMDARRRREDFLGRPVGKPSGPAGTDGPLTVACNLRGATGLMEDLLEDEPYFHRLMAFVTEGIIRRLRAWRTYLGIPAPRPGDAVTLADDSIAMISAARYREHVLPYHRRIVEAFGGGGVALMHLCGAAQHLFPTLVRELRVRAFEVGFPTDLGRARRELGPGIELIGNVHPVLLHDGPPAAIRAAVRAACESGVMDGGRYVLREGNNCAPGTPMSHFAEMYEAGKACGRY